MAQELRTPVVGGSLLCATLPGWARDAVGAELDPSAPIRLQGRLVKLECVNPHAWMRLDVMRGWAEEGCMVEGGTDAPRDGKSPAESVTKSPLDR